ncbi:F-box domain-containing protein [Mycena kentingensis (nom. inval.)]|nr:F-box domain-containing protein [Mycena kentingensis (nom. inval.)]
MATLPAELIHAIVGHIPDLPTPPLHPDRYPRPDTPTLRACCLAAPVFVDPAQRRMHRILYVKSTLETDGKDKTPLWTRALEHFAATPRLAGYVTHLRVHIDGEEDAANSEAAQCVLALLEHVEELSVGPYTRSWGDDFLWEFCVQGVAMALLDWMRRRCSKIRPLERITLFHLSLIPLAFMRGVYEAARFVELLNVSVDDWGNAVTNSQPRQSDIASIRALRARDSCGAVGLLLRNDFHQYTSQLEMIFIPHGDEDDAAPISALCVFRAVGLKSLYLDHQYSNAEDECSVPPNLRLPTHLPNLTHLSLKVVRIVSGSNTFERPWLSSSILPALLVPSCTPSLNEITIHVVLYFWDKNRFRPLGEDVRNLDDAFSVHPALERVHWLVDVNTRGYLVEGIRKDPAWGAIFLGLVQQALPKTTAKRRLQVDVVQKDSDFTLQET